jgi:hypothetical protein
MRPPTAPFRAISRPSHTAAPIPLPQVRHASPGGGGGKAWSKNKKKNVVAPGSNNPFLQGMNFDSSDHRIALARGILFSQRPMRGLRLNPQDQIRHETIHRAWMMFQNERRKARLTRLSNLEESVAGTMKALWETDEKLYNEAVAGTREVEKRFPLVMRIPTDTLPTTWWNYKWTSANIKGLGGVAPPG